MSDLKTVLIAVVAGVGGGFLSRVQLGTTPQKELAQRPPYCSDDAGGFQCEDGKPRGVELATAGVDYTANIWTGDQGGALGIFQKDTAVVDLGLNAVGPSDGSPKGAYLSLNQPNEASAADDADQQHRQAKIELMVSPQGDPSIKIFNRDGKVIWTAPTS